MWLHRDRPREMKKLRTSGVLVGGDAMAYAAARAVDQRAMREVSEHEVEAFVRRHREHVFRLAIMMMGDRDEAEDLTQEVFLRAFGARQKISSLSSPEAWLRKVLVRRAYSRLQRRKPVELVSEHSTKGASEQIEVRQVLATLSADQQVVLSLSMGEGLTYAEIAQALGIPEGTVASRLNTAKAAFRRAWEGQ
jgi:RNA polymerase sigma-70 factor, ECF subfamily